MVKEPLSDGLVSLSSREGQVLRLASTGLLDKEIGAELGLSLNTLRTYWTRIRSKVGEGSRSALVAAYVEYATSEEAAIEFDWEVEFATWIYRRLSDRPLHETYEIKGELSFDVILDLIHPEDRPGVRALVDRAMAGELREFHYAARLEFPDGPGLGSAFIRVVFDEEGKPVKMMGRRVSTFDMRKK